MMLRLTDPCPLMKIETRLPLRLKAISYDTDQPSENGESEADDDASSDITDVDNEDDNTVYVDVETWMSMVKLNKTMTKILRRGLKRTSLKSRTLAEQRNVEVPAWKPFDATEAMRNFVQNYSQR